MLHRSMRTTRTASRQAGAAPASQYAASSAVRPSTWPSRPCWPSRSKKQVCQRAASRVYCPVRSSTAKRGPAAAVLVNAQVRHRRCGLVQERVRGGGERIMRRRQEIPACRAASAGVIPRPVTSGAACSRSRAATRHRGGTAGTHSVNVLRGHCWLPHSRRYGT
jgi:hypothetical protein